MTDSFPALVADAQACCRCPGMEGRRRVLGPANGSLDAPILFVAEAPGRLGGDRTGVPLTSDQTGRNFTRLLTEAGLSRERVLITNAVLCNPRTNAGLNRPPASSEIENCRCHLRRLLDLARASTVVSLGTVALRAVAAIEPHGLILRQHVGQATAWRGRVLVPLYHPGPRALIHRPLARQQSDFRVLGTTIARSWPSGASPTFS